MGDSNGWGRFEWGHDWNPRVETSQKGPVVGMGGVVSRLEAMAMQGALGRSHVAAFVDARRGQVFGAVFQRKGEGLERLGEEMVIPSGKFIETATELVKGGSISWVSIDAAVLAS